MFRVAVGCLLVASLTLAAAAQDLDVEDGDIYDDEGRLLVVTMDTGAVPSIFNFTNGTGGLKFNGLLPLLLAAGTLAAATAISIAVPLGILHHGGYCGYGSGSDTGYISGSDSGSSYGNSGGYSSYSSYRR